MLKSWKAWKKADSRKNAVFWPKKVIKKMAKTYIDSVKYMIEIEFEIKGIVDKPDIIGAVFGQSEGLLGEQLDLRELQKNGRIGRIEITQNTNMGKTKGLLSIPSSLDMVETSILAAAVESVDKVGPFESKFVTKNIADVRKEKRKGIEERAKDLLKKMMTEQIPDTQEFTERIREDTRSAEIETYGPEKIPCGPGITEEDSIIVAEGRADVINLLKNGIRNVIAMGGAKPPRTLLELCRQKNTILFVDGDRGGELNVRKMVELTKVDSVAQAPEGKEVEELQRKEIVMALRRKATPEEFLKAKSENHYNRQPGFAPRFQPRMPRGIGARRGLRIPRAQTRGFPRGTGYGGSRNAYPDQGFQRSTFRQEFESPAFESHTLQEQGSIVQEMPRAIQESSEEKASAEELAAFTPIMQELKGSLKARFLNSENQQVQETEVREMLEELKKAQNVKAIIFDGIITKRVVEEAKKAGVKTIVGVKKGKIEKEKEIKVLAITA